MSIASETLPILSLALALRPDAESSVVVDA